MRNMHTAWSRWTWIQTGRQRVPIHMAYLHVPHNACKGQSVILLHPLFKWAEGQSAESHQRRTEATLLNKTFAGARLGYMQLLDEIILAHIHDSFNGIVYY